MEKLSGDLDALRKAQNLDGNLDENSNNTLLHLIEKINKIEEENKYYREIVATNEYADMNGDVLQAFV
jgi:hypothetical protein